MKTHLACSLKPLTEGSYLVALCSVSVPNSIFMFRFLEGEFDPKSASTLLLCRECTDELPHKIRKLQDSNPSAVVYVYGAQNRDELKPKQIQTLQQMEEGA